MDTKTYLDALESVISSRYKKNTYCIGGYQELSTCLQYDKNGWVVYNGERGNRFEEVKCDTVLFACLQFIRKMTNKAEDISLMETELLSKICSYVPRNDGYVQDEVLK